MKEASTQVELESDYESDIDSETSESDPLSNNQTVTVVHNALAGEPQPTPMITLTLPSELNLPNGDKENDSLRDLMEPL